MAPTDPPSIEDLGRLCLARLLDDASWVYRRKDSVELLSEHLQRHRCSVDFALPDDVSRQLPNGEKVHYVPLGMLRKAAPKFTRFDVTDESGRSLPLPTRSRNAQVSGEVLIAFAQRLHPSVDATLASALKQVAAEGPGIANEALERLQRSSAFPSTLKRDRTFRWLSAALARNSILVMPLEGDPGERRIIKIAYDEELDNILEATQAYRDYRGAKPSLYAFGVAPYRHTVAAPYVSARSYHFECAVPEGSRILKAQLWDNSSRQLIQSITGIRRPRVHLYLEDALHRRTVTAQATWRITSTFVGSAWLTSVGVLLVLLFAAVVVWCSPSALQQTGGNTPALLLVLPGLIATYLTQRDSPLAIRLLSRARAALAASGAASYVAAACVAAVPAIHNHTALWVDRGLLSGAVLVAAWSCYRLHAARRETKRTV